MTREELRHAVAARRAHAVDEREAVSIERCLTELDRLSAPFDEHADLVHATASAIVTSARGVVLHLHRRLGLWLQPGGHIDPGEEPWDAAVRETVEETGLAVRHPTGGPRFVHIDVHTGAKGHIHLDLRYLLEATGHDPCPPPGESPDVRWFTWENAIAIADEGLVGALRAIRP